MVSAGFLNHTNAYLEKGENMIAAGLSALDNFLNSNLQIYANVLKDPCCLHLHSGKLSSWTSLKIMVAISSKL
jgi:hypothetical protein